MKLTKRIFVLAVAAVLVLASASTAVFADIDYSSWDSQSGYPADVRDTTYFTSVKYLMDKKIMTGYSDGTFKPQNTITRAEIAVAVAKATNRTNNLDTMAQKEIFTDLNGYTWAKGYINALVDGGIIKGATATTYAPGENISYAELITILVRMNSGAASIVESSGTWPNNYIQFVEMYNYLGDVTVTDWNAPATRGDTAKLLYRFLPKKTTTKTTTSAISVDLKI